MSEATPFEKFVNTELPRRVSIEIPESGNLAPGQVLMSTGVGLGVKVADIDSASSGIIQAALVVNSTDKVIPKSTPLAVAVAKSTTDLTKGKLYVRPATLDDKVIVGVAQEDIGATDYSTAKPIFSEGMALLRGLLIVNYSPEGLNLIMDQLENGTAVAVYSGASLLTCDNASGIAVGQIIKFESSADAPDAPVVKEGETPPVPTVKTYVFVTLQGTEYASSGGNGGGSADSGTVIITGLTGTTKIQDADLGLIDKVSFQIVDVTTGLDPNLGQAQLLSASLIEQQNPNFLAIDTVMTLESGTKLKVINKSDNTALEIKTPTITVQNGLKLTRIEFADPTAVYSLAESAGDAGLYLQVIHPAGNRSDSIIVKTKAQPKFGSVAFTLPAGQTSVKTGDSVVLTVAAPANYKISKLEVGGELLYDKTNNGKEQSAAIFNSTQDPSKNTDKVIMTFQVTTKEVAMNGGVELILTLADGTVLYQKTKDLGDVQNFNWIKVDNVYPTLEILSIAYPAGQSALKESEKATLSLKADNIEKVVFSTPQDQLTIETPEITFADPANQAFTKDVARLAGEYNVTVNNLTVKAMKPSNGSFVSISKIIAIANVAAQLDLVVYKPIINADNTTSYKLTDGNLIQSSPDDAKIFFRFDLNSTQQLPKAPKFTLDGPGTLTDGSKAYNNITRIEYMVSAADVEDRKAGSLVLTESVNLAGIPSVFKINTEETVLNYYGLAGFVKRTLKVAGWPNRMVAIGVAVVNPLNVQCSNLSKGASNSLNYTYMLNTKNSENGFTLTNEAGEINPKGGFWFNCDQSNALSNTSGEMLIELEEIAKRPDDVVE
ncbi:hypothetical protein [Ewingella americana]|uniref:Uncharacterized protein n=1 Tax=Ewingella americana TaxID=41202 RepID=A0A502GGC4_9GAMM|nr:hypothetical protein [Ewingella americana]TPG60016.1 hypothetical protein EAH77_15730 [Ewingella americana]